MNPVNFYLLSSAMCSTHSTTTGTPLHIGLPQRVASWVVNEGVNRVISNVDEHYNYVSDSTFWKLIPSDVWNSHSRNQTTCIWSKSKSIINSLQHKSLCVWTAYSRLLCNIKPCVSEQRTRGCYATSKWCACIQTCGLKIPRCASHSATLPRDSLLAN